MIGYLSSRKSEGGKLDVIRHNSEFETWLKHPTRRWLYSVRQMVVPRLVKTEHRIEAGLVPIFYGPFDVLSEPEYVLYTALLGRAGSPAGETSYYHDGTAETVCIYAGKGIPLCAKATLNAPPKGQVMAFTLIHELAHAAVGVGVRNDPNDGHENPDWADCCDQMGIREQRYSTKGPDWDGCFSFLDLDLLARIRALPDYPGDDYVAK